MEGEGMTAVVRGLRDGLAVTLLDGSNQYTLMPSTGLGEASPHSPTRVHVTHVSARAQTQGFEQQLCRDSAAQATDGRYASMYKMAHCSVKPTSPPVHLTEFPPQRAELCRGQGNFEVGGLGSGENYTPCRSNGSFRGAMSWPDRGSVCSPRPSREPDAFANSLRKYPNVSMERSTEMVERLITYTQAKNISRSYQSRYPSPSRHSESNTSNQFLERNASRNTMQKSSSSQKNDYEPEVNISTKAKPRLEESPTRDMRTDDGDYRRVRDSKYLKDMTRKVRESIRSMSAYPYSQPVVSPMIRERFEQNSNLYGHRTRSLLTATNSVNMEVQAAAEMVSKEVTTAPRTSPVKRTVAVPLSPASSSYDQKPEGDVSVKPQAKLNLNPPTYKSVEIASMPVDLSVQTTSSSIDIANSNCRCFVRQRRSKSDENIRRGFGEEIFELLEKVSICPNADPEASRLRREVLKQMSTKLQKMNKDMNCNEGADNTMSQVGKLVKYLPIWMPCGDDQLFRDAVSEEVISRMNRYKSYYNVYRTETYFDIVNEGKSLDDVLRNWIGNIPFKSFDVFGKPVEKDSIKETLLYRIKKMIQNRPRSDGNSLKKDILNIISKLPIAANKFTKPEYLNDITDLLLNKINTKRVFKHAGDTFVMEPEAANHKKNYTNRRFKNYIQPTEEEIRECISDEVKHFLERTCSKTNSVDIRDIELEIIDYIIESIRAIRSGEDFVESELTMLLCQEIDNVSWSDAKQIAQKFLKLVENMFGSNMPKQEREQSYSHQRHKYVVLQNETARTCQNSTCNTNNSLQNSSDFSIGAISKGDIDDNLDAYMNELTTQIDEWLTSLQKQIPQAHDSGFRQVVVHDLAGDIIDRHKYLELNSASRGSDKDELEHLKYQIFKWINKLAGEDNMVTIEHAPELMQRIQRIPVPMLKGPQQNSSSTGAGSYRPQNTTNSNSIPRATMNTIAPQMHVNACTPINLNPSQALHVPTTPSIKQLNEEYDEFLKKWVQQIPIPSSTQAEKALADKARIGIYNGIWKAITKLKFEPATFNNQFYYEDAFDDEIEDLLSALPKSSELENKKHLLKVQLIERTTNTNELIKSTATPASFKQQLVENVSNCLPHKKEDPKLPNEELQVLRIVEDFILCSNYKDTDKIKANVYRRKLIQETQTLLDNIKKTHRKELQNIDTDLYMNSIFDALHKVPLPNDDTLQYEADKIMLGAEVEKWLIDLPVVPNDDGNEQLNRKKLKDELVKRIRELEKEVNIYDCSGERALKHEISSFLENMPMQQGENANITFMAEEFANRMKNKARQQQDGNATRKSVAFMDSVAYYDFSKHMPYCSSFSELPGTRPALINQSSYMIREGTRVQDPYGYNYFAGASLPPHVPLPSEEYFTMEDSQATPKPKQPPMQPQPVQQHNQYSKIQNYKSGVQAPYGYNNYAGASLRSHVPLSSDQYMTLKDYSQATPNPQPQMQPQAMQEHNPLPSNEYFTLQDSQGTPTPMQPQPLQKHNQYSRIESYKSIPHETMHYTMDQSAAPNVQSYQTSTVPPTASPEKQSPCCRSAAATPVRQQTIQGVNQSGQVQVPPAPQSISMTDIPPQPSIPCSARNQSNTSRMVNSSQRARTSMQTGMVNPEVVIRIPMGSDGMLSPEGVTKNGRLSEMPHRSLQMPPAQPRSETEEMQQPLEQIRENAQQRGIPGQVSAIGEPQGFSTPQQVITQGSPPKPGRKRPRASQRNRRNLERRRLELEDDTEDFESEADEPCHCMERMMRCGRPPACFAYEDFESEQCYPMPHGSFPLVTNNFTVQVSKDVQMRSRRGNQESTQEKTDYLRNIKSVQTSLSLVDLAPIEIITNCHRKIKSQDDLRYTSNKDMPTDVLNWLSNGGDTAKWSEKMQKLAQKLTEPGGEEKIRQKIHKYLKRVPNEFPECGEERREFRKQLPDSIIKKLKKIYLKPERKSNNYSPVRIFRIEIPKECCTVKDTFKDVIKNWLKEIPMKKKDLLGKGIRKEDVLDCVVTQLEPYILNRQNFDKHYYRSILKERIMDILNEMPIEIDSCDKTCYNNRLVLSLLNEILCLNGLECYTEPSNVKENKHNLQAELKYFVSNEIVSILNKLHLSASTKRLKLLEEEIKDTLLEVVRHNNDTDAAEDNIFTILHKLGGLSDYQAKYFTDVILKHFKEDFCEDLQEKTNTKNLEDIENINRIQHNETYSIYHTTAKIQSKVSNRQSIKLNNKDLRSNDEIKSNVGFYKHQVLVQIEEWLNELHIKLHFSIRDKAVNDLAEDIADRFMYLELNPSSKGPYENEIEYLKYQIFKWISRAAGDNIMEIIEHAHELMERIQSIGSSEEVTSKSTLKSPQNKERYSQLKNVITKCLKNIPKALDDIPNETKLVDDLASNLTRQIKPDADSDTVINEEINRWMTNVYTGKHKWVVRDKLKQSVKGLFSTRNRFNIDKKKEKILIRKYEDIIDAWIDNFTKISKEIVHFVNRNQHTHDLAVQCFNLINKEACQSNRYLEEVALKWAENCSEQKSFRLDHITKLVDSILACNDKKLIETNQEEHDKSYNSDKYQVDIQSNSVPRSKQTLQIKSKIARADIAVYGVTLPSNPKAVNQPNDDFSTREITDDDVQASLDLYLKQLVGQIDDWLGTLDIPQIHDAGFREIVVNDLAGDIIDRHKYLEFNPSSRGTDESELEQLKYQIFKWINKLVGEDQQETVEHAADLMNRIRNIPVPMLIKDSESQNESNRATNRNFDRGTTKVNTSAMPSNVRLSSPLGFTTGPMATTNKQKIVQMPLFGSQGPRSSLPVKLNANAEYRRFSGPPALGIPKTPTQQLQTYPNEQGNLPQGMSLDDVHKYFDKIFQERIKEIPLDTPNPEQELLANLARKGLYNGIWKTYFQLKDDPEIENDYSYFAMVFEDQLDNMLDCLPQTNKLKNMRYVWKIKVLSDVLSMLKYVHSITDRPSFREMIAQKFNRQYLRERELKHSDLIQEQYVGTVAKEYILHTKYKEEDPVKANIYRQRLMKKIAELADHIKSQYKVEFRFINHRQLTQRAFQLLESVPIPQDETLKEEVEEILVGDEIDHWYNGLPVKPVQNETEEELRKRMRELLAKKICEIEKRIDLDESAEQNVRHEVSKFLQEKAALQRNADLEINFMVEELMNRLKNRRRQNMLGYESFEKEKPVSSTFVQTDPGEVLAPLIDAGVNAEGPSPYELQEVSVHQGSLNQSRIMQGRGILGTSQVAGPSTQDLFYQATGQIPAPCQGVLGTSQIAGPSGQVPYQETGARQSVQDRGILGISQTSQQIAAPSNQFQHQTGQNPPPCCQGQGTNQLTGPNGQGSYQQPIEIPQSCLQSEGVQVPSEMAGPRQSLAPERFGNQSQQGRSNASDRSRVPPNVAPCAPNLPPSQIGAGQMYQGDVLAQGQTATSSLPPSTNFLTTQDPTPTATRSTVRIASSVPNQEVIEETDGEEEITYKCRCMERKWKCRKRRYCEDMGRYPRCYPMPFPCRYYF